MSARDRARWTKQIIARLTPAMVDEGYTAAPPLTGPGRAIHWTRLSFTLTDEAIPRHDPRCHRSYQA